MSVKNIKFYQSFLQENLLSFVILVFLARKSIIFFHLGFIEDFKEIFLSNQKKYREPKLSILYYFIYYFAFFSAIAACAAASLATGTLNGEQDT